VDFYTSHEGLNLHYESAQTRQVPWRQGWYDLTTHLPWIGEELQIGLVPVGVLLLAWVLARLWLRHVDLRSHPEGH